MNDFTIVQKTKLIFGKEKEREVGREVKAYSDKYLIVHDGGAYLKELLETVRTSLRENDVEYVELGNVKANPLLSTAEEGMRLVREHDLGFVLAVGGGSVMDTGKYIAVGTYCPFPAIEYKLSTVSDHKILPHGCISTLSGTGSEFSNCAMIVDDHQDPVIKAKLLSSAFFNDFAIVDPELNYSLPAKQTACGAMDMISHCLENYLTDDDSVEIGDYYLEGIIRTALKYAPVAIKEPRDYTARANLCIASNLAMTPNMSIGGNKRDWAIHGIENNVTARYHKTHGEMTGVMTLAYLRWCLEKGRMERRLVKWAHDCMGVQNDVYRPKLTIERGIKASETWLQEVGLATRLSDLDINPDDLKDIAEISAPAGNLSKLSPSEIMEIYELAR